MSNLLSAAWSRVRSIRREDGQTMTEYALIVGVVAIAAVVALAALNSGISSAIAKVVASLPK